MKKRLLLFVGSCIAFGGPSLSPLSAMNMVAFRDCIGFNYGGHPTTCQLDPGIHQITQKLELRRSGITVRGTFTWSRSETTLKRGVAGLTSIMEAVQPVYNVTIQDFLFDGNRALTGDLPGQAAEGYRDLYLGGWGSNIVVQADFVNAPGFGMTVAGSYTAIQYCNGTWGRIGTVWGGSSSSNVTIVGNIFENNGAGAVGIASPISFIAWNSFYGNHRDFPYGESGGQLVLLEGGSYITVTDNWLDGAYIKGDDGIKWTSGIEGYGSYHNFARNEAFHHSGQGLAFIGVQNVTITGVNQGWRVEENSTREFPPQFDGIAITNHPNIPQWSANITIDGVTSINGHRYGIYIDPSGFGNITA